MYIKMYIKMYIINVYNKCISMINGGHSIFFFLIIIFLKKIKIS